jgi:hypothetical protein
MSTIHRRCGTVAGTQALCGAAAMSALGRPKALIPKHAVRRVVQ